MRWQHSPMVQWLAMSLLFGFILFLYYHQDVAAYRYKQTHASTGEIPPHHPAGEITSRFVVEQPLLLKNTELQGRDLKQPFCVSLLMANYMNRRNQGEFSVSLRVGERSQNRLLQARKINDNTWEFVCFDEFRLADVLGKSALLTISGVDGQPGRSVTAWLTAATSADAQATLNGQRTDQQLLFSTHVRIHALPHMVNGYVLMALAAMIMAALTLGSYRAGRSAKVRGA
ncbi:MAG: hypothetical protein EP308_05840 [Burkholderiales bacterium]|nr:MAG: hypothetical protein EP308_05840 [Burkholderiales bacterium]